MNLNKQKENVNILLQLIKENPDLPILPFVATECVFDDKFSYWMAEWCKAEVGEYWVSDERIYFSDDYDELVEKWIDNNHENYPNLSDEELEKLAEEKVSSYEWVKAIVVFINQL